VNDDGIDDRFYDSRSATTYDKAGNVTDTASGLGTNPGDVRPHPQVTTTVYDTLNRPKEVYTSVPTETETLTKTFYDPAGNVDRIEAGLAGPHARSGFAAPSTATYAYDAQNRQTAVTVAAGTAQAALTLTEFDPAGNVSSVTSGLAGSSSVPPEAVREIRVGYGYDDANRQVVRVDGQYSGLPPEEWAFTNTEYTPSGAVKQVSDPAGNVTTYTYNVFGEADGIEDRQGTVADYQRDAGGRLTIETDGNGNETDHYYDALGREYGTVRGAGSDHPLVSGVIYDAAGQVQATFDGLNHLTQRVYDSLGSETSRWDSLGTIVDSRSDANGQLIRQTDARGVATAYEYNSDGLRLETTVGANNPNAQTTRDVYDAAGNLALETDSRGVTTSFSYDALGQQTAVVEALGWPIQQVTETAYDTAGNVRLVIDPRQTATQYAYDDLNRETRTTETFMSMPTQRVTERRYDQASRVTSETDALGVRTDYQYDYRGNQILARRGVGLAPALLQTTEYEYDAADNLTSVVDTTGLTTTYAFDAVNRQTGTTVGARAPSEVVQTSSSEYDAAGNLTQTTDAVGLVTGYEYDYRDHQTEATQTGPGVSLTTGTKYDLAGNVTETVDARGKHTGYQFDGFDRLTRTNWPDSTWTGVAYETYSDLVAATTDQYNRPTAYAYDALGRQTQMVNAAGKLSQTEYRLNSDLVETQTDELGRPTTYVYDAMDRLTQVQDAAGGHTDTTYVGTTDLVETTTDANGHLVALYLYDDLGRVTATINGNSNDRATVYRPNSDLVWAQSDENWNRTTYAYDALGRQTAALDALNRTVATVYAPNSDDAEMVLAPDRPPVLNEYDALDRLTKTTDAAGHTTETMYDAAGNVTAVKDQLGRWTNYAYDDSNRLTTTQNALAQTMTFRYDSVGNQTRRIDPRGVTVATAYDAMGRPTAVVDTYGHGTQSEYDDVGNLTKTVDAQSKVTTYLFDRLNRQTEVRKPNGAITGTEYDRVGNVTAAVDGLGKRTTYAYDNGNRLTRVTDPRLGVTQYGYDPVGNRTAVVDAAGNRTEFVYDDGNRPTAMVDSHSHLVTYAHDGADRQTSTTDQLGRRIDDVYDALGRLTLETWRAPGGAVVSSKAFEYDWVGNLTAAADPAGAYGMQYDALNRVTAVTEPGGLALGFTYDLSGNRDGVSDSRGGDEQSVYDLANRLVLRTFTDGETGLSARYMYTDRNQVAAVDRYADAAGVNWVGATTYAYDEVGRLTAQTDRDHAGAAFRQANYAYDAADRVTFQAVNGTGRTFTYDANDELTGDGSAAHTYDATRNRTDAGYVTPAANETTTDAVWTYVYDDAGNRVKKTKGASAETWTYGYDDANHLTRVTQSATDGGPAVLQVDYTYDVFGNRLSRTQAGGGGPTTQEVFAYDGWKVSQDAQGNRPQFVGQENWDAWADLAGNGTLTTRRVYGDGTDQPVARLAPAVSGGATAWYHQARQGSVTGLTDTAGVVADQIAYNGFGDVVSETAPAFGDRYGYTAREKDVGGLMFYRDRVLATDLDRFLTRDRLGFQGGDSNLTRYVRNGFTNGTDPSGNYIVASNTVAAASWASWFSQSNHGPGLSAVKVSPIRLSDGRTALRMPLSEQDRFRALISQYEGGDEARVNTWLKYAFNPDEHIELGAPPRTGERVALPGTKLDPSDAARIYLNKSFTGSTGGQADFEPFKMYRGRKTGNLAVDAFNNLNDALVDHMELATPYMLRLGEEALDRLPYAIQLGGAVLEVGGGIILLAVPEGVLSKIGGAILIADGSDNGAQAWNGLLTGKHKLTLKAQAAGTAARGLGANPDDVRLTEELTDTFGPMVVPSAGSGLSMFGRGSRMLSLSRAFNTESGASANASRFGVARSVAVDGSVGPVEVPKPLSTGEFELLEGAALREGRVRELQRIIKDPSIEAALRTEATRELARIRRGADVATMTTTVVVDSNSLLAAIEAQGTPIARQFLADMRGSDLKIIFGEKIGAYGLHHGGMTIELETHGRLPLLVVRTAGHEYRHVLDDIAGPLSPGGQPYTQWSEFRAFQYGRDIYNWDDPVVQRLLGKKPTDAELWDKVKKHYGHLPLGDPLPESKPGLVR
jgi:RHS repeat-associated protein